MHVSQHCCAFFLSWCFTLRPHRPYGSSRTGEEWEPSPTTFFTQLLSFEVYRRLYIVPLNKSSVSRKWTSVNTAEHRQNTKPAVVESSFIAGSDLRLSLLPSPFFFFFFFSFSSEYRNRLSRVVTNNYLDWLYPTQSSVTAGLTIYSHLFGCWLSVAFRSQKP